MNYYKPETIPDLIDRGLHANELGIAAVTKQNGHWQETSTGDFQTRMQHFALGLYALGLRKGDRVAIRAGNRTDWIMSDYAMLSTGVICVPVYPTQPGDQVRMMLENSEARVLIVAGPELLEPIESYISEIPTLEKIISLQGDIGDDRQINIEEVIRSGRETEQNYPELFGSLRQNIDPYDIATIIYTSGATGTPKGVQLTHNSITHNIKASLERIPFDSSEWRRMRTLSFLPLSHIFERIFNFAYMYLGYPVYYIESLDEIAEDIRFVKPHFFATVPRLLEKVYDKMQARKDQLSGLQRRLYRWALDLAGSYNPEKPAGGWKYKLADRLVYSKMREALGGELVGVISGGAPLPENLMRFFNGIGVYCGQGYGLTEMAPVIAITGPDYLRVGSVGKPIAGVEVRIADDGEILAHGPNLMKGYLHQPETTEKMFRDGWLATGDIGRLDEDGYLFVTDRKKDMFKLSTGKYVAPQNIENKLNSHAYIEQVSVVGNMRKFCGAIIVPSYEDVARTLGMQHSDKEEMANSRQVYQLVQQVVDHVNTMLPDWEKIKSFTIVAKPFRIEDGELTPTLKKRRQVIAEHYSEEIERIYAGASEGKMKRD